MHIRFFLDLIITISVCLLIESNTNVSFTSYKVKLYGEQCGFVKMDNSEDSLRKFQEELQGRSKLQVIIESLAFTIMVFLAIAGNAFTLYVIWKKKQLRNATNYFIACSAVSDMVLGMCSEPLFVSTLILSKWPFGHTACQYQGYVAVTMSCVSIQTLAWTAFSRYVKVVKSNGSTWFSKKKLIISLSFIWGSCILAPAPYLLFGENFVFHPAKFFCYFTLDDVWFTVILMSIYVALPTTAIVFFYSKVFIKISKHSTRLERSDSAMNVEEIKVTRSLVIIVFAFMLCWTPVLIIDLVDTVRGTWSLPREAYMTYTYLATLSTCVNPFIYGLTHPQLRKEYAAVSRSFSPFKNDRVQPIDSVEMRTFSSKPDQRKVCFT